MLQLLKQGGQGMHSNVSNSAKIVVGVTENQPFSIQMERAAQRSDCGSARLASDPEREAFIRARIDHLTFAEIFAKVATTLPPHRRTSLTALSRRWKVNRHLSPDRS